MSYIDHIRVAQDHLNYLNQLNSLSEQALYSHKKSISSNAQKSLHVLDACFKQAPREFEHQARLLRDQGFAKLNLILTKLENFQNSRSVSRSESGSTEGYTTHGSESDDFEEFVKDATRETSPSPQDRLDALHGVNPQIVNDLSRELKEKVHIRSFDAGHSYLVMTLARNIEHYAPLFHGKHLLSGDNDEKLHLQMAFVKAMKSIHLPTNFLINKVISQTNKDWFALSNISEFQLEILVDTAKQYAQQTPQELQMTLRKCSRLFLSDLKKVVSSLDAIPEMTRVYNQINVALIASSKK